MKFKSIFTLAIILTIATAGVFAQKAEPTATVKLPSVKKILANYVKALGGRKANKKIKTRMMAGTLDLVPMGVKGKFETYSASEAKSYTKMNLAGIGDMIEVFDGKSAWSVNPIQGSREKSGAELMQARLINTFHRDINLNKLYPKMVLKGIEKVGDKDAYVIIATAEGIPPETWYFDTVSGLLFRSDMTIISPEGNQSAKIYVEEMRAVDSVKVPVKIRIQLPLFEMTMTTTEVKHGVTIEDTRFAKPKQ